MNPETTNHLKRNGLLWKIGRFLWLFFWEYPIRREKNPISLAMNYLCYNFIFIFGFMGLFFAHPDIPADKFPSLEQTTVVEGRIIRHPSLRGGSKYVSEPLGIETATGPIFKQCTTLGVSCLEFDEWKYIESRPAKLWFWNEWAIQLEVDGVVPKRLTYEHKKKVFTSNPAIVFVWLIGIVIVYMLIRISRRYLVAVYKEVFISYFEKES
ncbi:MAG TPA: hypothetical protein VJ001_16715 [Rhodocyclaceae bacterium]|nr:hypothetical protein [Rhodocyclaceae bacterium]